MHQGKIAASDMASLTEEKPGKKRRKPLPLHKAFWRRIRRPLVESQFVKQALASLIYWGMRFVAATNPRVAGSDDPTDLIAGHSHSTFTFWHGQHLMIPTLKPKSVRLITMFSKSADAELNALVTERFGIEVLRGSAAREREKTIEKGGIRALIALRKGLAEGKTVAMVSDIPKGVPRQAGMGIVTLGRISGKPIIPFAYATSRRWVIEKSWDKTTISLPFGRSAVRFGQPIDVPADADEAGLERIRKEIEDSLNAVTREAYALVDAGR